METITLINSYYADTKRFKMLMSNNYHLGCDCLIYYQNSSNDNCIAKFRVKLKQY